MAHMPPGTTTDEHGRPLDQIRLVGITQTGYHGVLDFEREQGQPFIADVTVHLDTRRAAASDDLSLTLNYGVLAEQISQVLAGQPVNLIETVAEQVAAVVLDYAVVGAVDVLLHKPKAPITVPFDDVVVAIRRDRVKLPAARFEAASPVSVPPSAVSPAGSVPGESAAGAHAQQHVSDPLDVASPAEGSPQGAPKEAVPAPDRMDVVPPGPVRVVLALGSNMGEPKETLRNAIADLVDSSDLEVLAVAPLARTAAVGGPEQEDFLNTVVLVRTQLAPRQLLRLTQSVEAAHGRARDVRWGPRTLDIDLINYDNLVAVTDDLELPHPRAHERAFVLQPWEQIEPDAHLPGLGGGPVDALAATAPDAAGVRWLALDWLEDRVAPGTPPAPPVQQPTEQPPASIPPAPTS